jgi:C-terminal processing protease CtpA/Prc
MKISVLIGITALATTTNAFVPSLITTPLTRTVTTSSSTSSSTASALQMAKDDDAVARFNKASRTAGVDDRLVELKRPLGLVLEEDDNGNVYVDAIAPKGNAARTGMIKEGDILVMCSATFGDQMWSCRGSGLSRVLSAIRVRAGPTVKLVFESSAETVKKSKMTSKALKAAEEARVRAQEKKDQLLAELQADEKKLKKGKFLGLF